MDTPHAGKLLVQHNVMLGNHPATLPININPTHRAGPSFNSSGVQFGSILVSDSFLS